MDSWTLEVRLLELRTRHTLAAGHDPSPEPRRLLTVVQLSSPDGDAGWGECSALTRPGYTSESAASAFSILSEAPELAHREGGVELLAKHPMAMAALEMAELDLRLKQQSVTLADYLGVSRTSVPAGAVLPLAPIDTTVTAARDLARQGFSRLKVKIVPSARIGHTPAELVRAVQGVVPGVEIQVDANGSFAAANKEELLALLDVDVSMIEQPFAVAQIALATELVTAGATVAADEAATDLGRIQQLVSLGACSSVVVKSSRLGGLFSSFEVLGWCEENGVPASAGGMLESGLGRHALAVVAANDACTITGDLSPARHWLAEDPWLDIVMTDGMIGVPAELGVAPPPNPEVLEKCTTRIATRRLVR